MITPELMASLREYGMGNVCLYNGKWMFNDGRPLSAEQTELVQAIAEGRAPENVSKKTPADDPGPVHKTIKPAAKGRRHK